MLTDRERRRFEMNERINQVDSEVRKAIRREAISDFLMPIVAVVGLALLMADFGDAGNLVKTLVIIAIIAFFSWAWSGKRT